MVRTEDVAFGGVDEGVLDSFEGRDEKVDNLGWVGKPLGHRSNLLEIVVRLEVQKDEARREDSRGSESDLSCLNRAHIDDNAALEN